MTSVETPRRVVVVGAGVVGLCTARQIQEALPQCQLTIMADRFGPETTSDGAAGIFRPVADHMPGVPLDLLRRWSRDSWDYYSRLAESSEADCAGATIVSGYHLFYKLTEKEQIFKDLIYNYRPCSDKELLRFPGAENRRSAYAFTTVIVECRWFLPWLTEKLKSSGALFVKRCISSLEELSEEYDVIVNCTGLGSRHLVNDPQMISSRGQVIRVKAPWIKHALWIDGGTFVFPCKENVVVGGTKQYDNNSIVADDDDRRQIWNSACKFIPSLKGAVFERDWVGLRPHRSPLRVERETMTFKTKPVQVVHNYGHGSYGVALGWGTGRHAVRLVKEALAQHTVSKL